MGKTRQPSSNHYGGRPRDAAAPRNGRIDYPRAEGTDLPPETSPTVQGVSPVNIVSAKQLFHPEKDRWLRWVCRPFGLLKILVGGWSDRGGGLRWKLLTGPGLEPSQ